MKKITLTVLPLLLVATTLGRASLDDYKDLVAEYREAVAEYEEAFSRAPLAERRGLRKNHPVAAFWDRFETLGTTEGRAKLWLIGSAKKSGMKSGATVALKKRLFDELFSGGYDQPWMPDAIFSLARNARKVGADFAEGHLRHLLKSTASRTMKGIATAKLGEILSASSDAERAAEGERILAEYAAKFINEGAMAIDFDAATIDGHEFKLSDYRGKAVLVDFYGFW